jgi:hypothetical protein
MQGEKKKEAQAGVASAPMVLAPASPVVTNGRFQLQASAGAPRMPIILESSPNLQQWQPVSTNTTMSDTLDFALPAVAQRAQFYRARQ